MEKQKAHEVLNSARERGAIICLYRNYYSSRFSVGFVLAVAANGVVLESLSTRGHVNGWMLRELDDVCRIDHGGIYEEKLQSLYRARGETHAPDFLGETNAQSNLRIELLQASQEHDCAVRLSIGAEEDIEGFVREVGLETVTIEKYNEYGQADGDSVLDMEKIESINVDDEELRDLKLLARWHELPPS